MRLYRVKWPGETILVFAESDEELFLALDELGSPFEAEIEEVSLDGPLLLTGSREIEKMDLRILRRLKAEDIETIMEGLYHGNLH